MTDVDVNRHTGRAVVRETFYKYKDVGGLNNVALWEKRTRRKREKDKLPISWL